ncbi:hypothetical protein, variant [Aphanomyces invadans]|uniref:Uncharacterized protein n=1 Tax=Aphanomyces invadans TaxID=157072 RepID=A0A024UCZ0_9STRA|nr:hypothetical protein, variant [Aphanomyces invadans]ETW03752.1 hypothetical protein, variant [Aphanomyces invadans]|eukprot:XP_008867981.1 hypothetical protein, variant [Aphanomyces invadans]
MVSQHAMNDPTAEAAQAYMRAMKRAAIDYAAGCLGGVMGIIVGQPFDTIKVRLQTHGSHYASPWHCARHTLQYEGVRGLFKGLVSPLVGSVPINAVVFGVHGSTLPILDKTDTPSLSSIYYAGSIAGFVQSFIVAPTDLVKCQLQVQDGFQRGGQRAFAGPIECIRHITAKHGARGMFQATLRHLQSQRANGLKSNPTQDAASMLFAGGCAGVVSWAIIYPLDVVKSVIQSLPTTAPKSDLSLPRQAKLLYSVHGLRIFTKGLGTTMLRAFPVNAVTFYVYEMTMAALS